MGYDNPPKLSKGVINMYQTHILELIDNIDKTTNDSGVAVISSMLDIIDKSMIIEEFYNDDDIYQFSIFQEGEILDNVKKQSEKDSNKFITIIKFIPRLIRAIIASLKMPKNTESRINDAKNNINKMNKLSAEEKRERVDELNEKFNGSAECYFDEKSGKIKFKKNKGSIIAKLTLHGSFVVATLNLFRKIKKSFDVLEPNKIRDFIDDCDRVLHGDQNVSKIDLFDGGLDALGELMSCFFTASTEITVIGAEVCTMMDDLVKKDMIKDVPNEKKQQSMKNIKELSSKIAEINAQASVAVGSMKSLINFGNNLSWFLHTTKDEFDKDMNIWQTVIDENPRQINEDQRDYMNRVKNIKKEKKRQMISDEKEARNNAREQLKQQRKDEREARHNKNK